MDLEEGWELLPDDGFLDFHEDGEKKALVGKRSSSSYPKSIFKMDYFNLEPPPTSESPRVGPKQIVPAPFQLEPRIRFNKTLDDDLPKEVTKVPIDVTVVTSAIPEKKKLNDSNFGLFEPDQDAKSQVFFKKTNNNESVDMKLDSPRSIARGILPSLDAGTFNFEEKVESFENDTIDFRTSPRKKDFGGKEEEVHWVENSSGIVNLWKWSLTGIGAICSFGVAAATICIIIFGSQGNKQNQKGQKLRFKIYTDDKRIKQVVHHATRLNEAMRGIPVTRAQITIGGYYDGP